LCLAADGNFFSTLAGMLKKRAADADSGLNQRNAEEQTVRTALACALP